MRALRLGAATLVAVLASPLLLVTPASADTIDGFTLTNSSVPPGDTVTATATWTSTTTGDRDVRIVIPAGLSSFGAVWKSLSYTTSPTPTVPAPLCVFDTPPTEASCLWRPAVDETITLTAEFDIPATTAPGMYDLTAEQAPTGGFDVVRTSTLTVLSNAAPAVTVTPTSATPGSTAVLSGTFTATTTGNIKVGTYLLGTGGSGSFGTATSTTGLTGCTLDSTGRAFSCDWTGATVGDTRTIVIPVNVASTATAGQSWTAQACANPNTTEPQCASTPLAIVAAASATPTPTPTPTATPTPTPTPTASASTAPTSSASSTAAPDETSTTEAVPTAVPAGEGPSADPADPIPLLPLLAGVLAVAGGAWFMAARRSGRHEV